MKPDSMLVELEHIITARDEVAAKGGGPGLEEFAKSEPALASFVHESLLTVAGKMSLAGAPSEVVQGVHEDVLTMLLTSLEAVRRGHYALWKETVTGTRLAQLDPSLEEPKPAKQSQPDDPEPTSV